MQSRCAARATALGLAALLELSGCGPTPSRRPASDETSAPRRLPIPRDLEGEVRRAAGVGRQLYVLDKVAAIGTDVLLENVQNPQDKGIAGYIPVREGDALGPRDSFLVLFFTRETPATIAYSVRVAPDVKPVFEAFDPPKAGDASFETLVRARQAAIAAMPPSNQPINPVVLPGDALGEPGILVYLLAGTKRPDVAVFGKHFRALVQDDGTRVAYMVPLSKGALEVPTRGPNGEKPEALLVSQTLTDFPIETHVFTSLLTQLPVFVATRRGGWLVNGGEISFVRERSANGG